MAALKLTLESLQVIDAIDRKGSYAAAAEELHRVPSALTYSVQKLEQDLDVLVFDRRGHRAQLTEAGRELLDEGRHLLRAAGELECRVKRVATGWETELRIAVDTVIAVPRLFPLVEAFYAQGSGTRLRITTEVLGGNWDALAGNRADLVFGASGEAPPGGGYTSKLLGWRDHVYAVAPTHPLASEAGALKREQILAHRAVAVGDSSRSLAPRSVGLLTGQDVLTVPDMAAKVAAQVAGLGSGYLPAGVAVPLAKAGKLVIKQTQEAATAGNLYYAWRTADRGKALRWFVKRMEDEKVRAEVLEPM
ncbi:MAG: LysR family transcriptional regulator [Gammaproteobacteria bacterium RIFCSPLOWO2_02_FULL_61_13]|nr:MAG: LysR family transcriptional regulator [Gammaproteobacteria bacterium RIFCSPLOWO2_02_FULL_61_13]